MMPLMYDSLHIIAYLSQRWEPHIKQLSVNYILKVKDFYKAFISCPEILLVLILLVPNFPKYYLYQNLKNKETVFIKQTL